MAEKSRSTADLIVKCLENEGVTHVFGIPGGENLRLIEALSESSIHYVLTRHEQGASFMAEACGRLTGKADVCSATLGPGAINLLLGTADATTNSTPLIALSAHVGMQRAGSTLPLPCGKCEGSWRPGRLRLSGTPRSAPYRGRAPCLAGAAGARGPAALRA